jgi:hypothetical protein
MLGLSFFILFSILSLNAEAASVPDVNMLMKENSLLKSEYPLAKATQIYSVFNFSEKIILIKSKGMVLKALPMTSFTWWGRPVQPMSLTLLRKDAFIKPGRGEIKPKKNEEENPPDLRPLQTEDMPARYHLMFENGIVMHIKPHSNAVITTVLNFLSSMTSFLITRPMGSLWSGLRRKPFTDIVVDLDEKDAKSLYWSLLEGFHCIIWKP